MNYTRLKWNLTPPLSPRKKKEKKSFGVRDIYKKK